ncbi:vacuolar transporter chaperone complex subunit 2 [Diutina catenulata]
MSDNHDTGPRMLFANKLENEMYPPWKEYYMNYTNLKKLLKEGVILQNNWTEQDEQNFVAALDADLDKVFSFQVKQFEDLNGQLNVLQAQTESADKKFDADKFSTKLDEILNLAQELEHFQRINYTGFTKIVKKHDRIHSNYSVKPLLNVRLKSLPFHSEDYSPLLYKVGTLFSFLRDNYGVSESLAKLSSFNDASNTEFQSFKFWVHPDNLMEVKTTILRHLPVLVYKNELGDNAEQDDDDDDDDDEPVDKSNDLTINCLYFDNDHFELYNSKLTKINNSSTLRIKWIGKLLDKPKIVMEKKQFDANAHFSIDDKLVLKQKYINPFVISHQIPDKLNKLNDPKQVQEVHDFIVDNNLQPMLRTVYKRTAFQIPGDDRVRVVLDSDLTFIREDAFDSQLPIRDPHQWHRSDIDSNTSKPLSFLRKGEYSKFPYTTMEIKIKKSAMAKSRSISWINDLIHNSHLVKEIPNFSKFIHGVASLYLEDDKLDNVPLWFAELENDLSYNPEAYIPLRGAGGDDNESSQSIEAVADEDNLLKFKEMVKSGDGSGNFQPRSSSFSGSLLLGGVHDPSVDPKARIPRIQEVTEDEDSQGQSGAGGLTDDISSSEDDDDYDPKGRGKGALSKLFHLPSQFSKLIDVDSEDEEIDLPTGVIKPDSWIKNAGPIKIEPKVWLANERTFNRWLNVTATLMSLTFIVVNTTQRSNFVELSKVLAYFYFFLTVFACLWGYFIFIERRKIILERSDRHLDNVIGPLVVAVGLMLALVVNFVFGWKALDLDMDNDFYKNSPFHKSVHEFVVKVVS